MVAWNEEGLTWWAWKGHSRQDVLPTFFVLLVVAAAGAGLWFSALNVRYRDFRYVVPFLLQLGVYISPVGFLSSVIPDRWRLLYALNPMVGIIDGFRWSLLSGAVDLYIPGLLASIALVIVTFFSGVRYFRKTEATFADVI